MIRRILVALSDVSGVEPLYQCLAALPSSRTAEVTVITTIGTSAWTGGLPDLMSAGTAARLLDIRPWEASVDSLARMVHAFAERCEAGGVRCSVQAPETNPIDSVVRACRLHDLVIAGLPPLMDQQGDSILERAIECSGIPVIRVGRVIEAIRRVVVLLSDDAASFRALRALVTLHPWPAAATTIAAFRFEPEGAASAAAYSAEHGIVATPLQQEFRSRADVLAWTAEHGIDAIVTGWPGAQTFARLDDDIPVLFLTK